ncbi:MAG: hypothetical protein HMLKMBBP_01200 [Planctomycetes bacterium]|nr:hypothetical protein [Planctomycetota bacterium]
MTTTRLTRDGANAALPFVRAVATDLRDLAARIAELEASYRRERRKPQPSQTFLNDRRREIRALEQDRAGCTAELASIGAGVDDAATGSVSIPGTLDGADVLFCWCIGEERVETWRLPGEPFDARRPLPEPVGV